MPTRFERMDDDLVLSQSSVQAFAQDRTGYLWIGTQAGLDRYDGYSIRSWTSRAGDADMLSFDWVRDLLVSSDDRLWVGTARGLDRLDPRSGRVTRFPVQRLDGSRTSGPVAYGSIVEDAGGHIYATALVPAQPVRWRPGRTTLEPVAVTGLGPAGRAARSATLLRDRGGRLWLVRPDGLWRLQRARDRFERVLDVEIPGAARVSEHTAVAGPGRGITVASADGLYVIDPDADRPVRLLRARAHDLPADPALAVAAESGGAIWYAGSDVLVRIGDDGRWRRFQLDPPGRPSYPRANRLFLAEPPSGDVWLAGDLGLFRFDPESGRLDRHRHDPRDPSSPPPTLARNGYSLFLDRFGTLWVGGDMGGVARLAPHSERFVHVLDETPSDANRNIVRAIAEQSAGGRTYVWTANEAHGVTAWERIAAREYRIAASYDGRGALGALGAIHDIAVRADAGGVWLAGHGGLGRIRHPGAALEAIEFDHPEPPWGVRHAAFLDDDTLLAAGGSGGRARIWMLSVGDEGARVQRVLTLPDPQGAQILDVRQRADGDLVVATGAGLAVVDATTGAVRRHFPSGLGGGRALDQLPGLAPDGEGGFWIGTRGEGLLHVRFTLDDQAAFSRPPGVDALPDDTIYALLRDDDGALWLSTNRGIARFEPATGAVSAYTPGDGLQGWEFNNTVAHAGASGRFYFGGINGWNVFEPDAIRPLPEPPRVDLVGVRVNDTVLEAGAGDRPLSLPHDRNRLVIDYVGVHTPAPERIRYAYRLAGVDRDWVDAGRARQARYASLAPGDYRFEVRAANLDGVWSPARSLLEFEIRRPPWATPGAWMLYAVAAVLAAVAALAWQKHKRRRLHALVDRRTAELREQRNLVDRQARQLEEALEARTTLFANISHEFRTPLTLIQASVDKLARRPDPADAALARKYIARLLHLVEQLLDLARLGQRRAEAQERPWRLDSVVSQAVAAFGGLAEERGLRLDARIEHRWATRCAQEPVEKIVLNLLSNAIKFTPPGGCVQLVLEAAEPQGAVIRVSDTGPGIPADEQERIFERFYRAGTPRESSQAGAGIGLALVFEAARAVGGEVRVESEPGRGAHFAVTLPAERIAASADAPPVPAARVLREIDRAALGSGPAARPGRTGPRAPGKLGLALVVEDNADLRTHVADCLAAADWRVIEAADGREGCRLAREHGPDVIVSDLMMPDVDGFEMLVRLRDDLETSHIPVLFLTARQDDETRVKAFMLRADGLLAKPFSVDELTARLARMLEHSEALRAQRRSRIAGNRPRAADRDGAEPASPNEPEALSARDRRFLERLENWLAENYADRDADVHTIAAALAITPRTLQRKLRSLAGATPAAYLRDYRMARARDLLPDPDRSVTEVAHAVGYSSSQYFSRVFRQVHGESPEAWRRRNAGLADKATRSES